MLALASLATSAMAEVKLSFDDIALFLGKSTPVTVLMDNDEDGITNLQFDLTLPDGMTMDVASAAGTDRFSADQSVKVARQGDGAYRFVIVSTTNNGFAGNEGALLTFNVTATEAPADGAALTMSKIVAVEGTSKLTTSATPGAITVLAEGVTFEAAATEVTVTDGVAQIDVVMNNSMDLVGAQGVITLPEGLTAEAADFVKSDRLPASATISYNAETGVFIVGSTDNALITGNYGTLFSILLKADATLAATSEVTLSQLVASTPAAQSIRQQEHITVTVTNEAAPLPDPVVLNAPTWNAENGTQAAPYMLADGTPLKITYTADNLEANGLTADELQVKITVIVSGDVTTTMAMGSQTVHRVMGETFYIPLGETDFPVALKEGYYYQNVAVAAAQLVKPATDSTPEEVVASYAGAPVMLRWIGVPISADAAYQRALDAIEDGKNYRIFTEVDGTKYYVTDGGQLTSRADDGGIFNLTKVTGGTYKEYGFRIDTGSKRFTNPPLANNVANLNPGVFATSTNNRIDWEAQVLFMFNDKYAIRSCNVPDGTSSWNDAGRTYWTYAIEEVAPLYTYDPTYVWQFEGPLTTINVTYQLYESDGTTQVGAGVTKKQEANSGVSIPAEFTAVAFYDYTTEGTIGDADCTVKVFRTMKAGVVHALADLSNEKTYTIACDRGALLTKDGNLASTAHGSLTGAAAADFAIISYEDKYYLYSVADKQFVTFNPSETVEGARGPLADMPTHGIEDALNLQPKTDPYFLATYTAGGANYGLNTNGNDPYGYVINSWVTADAGNQYFIIESGDFDPKEALAALDAYFHPTHFVTYVVKDEAGNELFTSEPVPAIEGSKITTLPAEYQRVFTTYDEVDVTITEPQTTVEFTATWNGPLALAPDFASITWQNMYIDRGADNHWYLSNGDAAPTFAQNPTDEDLASDAYQWGFVGNPYEGIKVYNKSTGEAQTLTNGTAVTMADGEFLWTDLAKNGEGILIGVPGNYLNQSGGATATTLGLWHNVTDAGSTWFFSEVPVIPSELELTLDIERYIGQGYGVTEATVDFAEALAFLGVETLTTDMLRVVNPDGTEISDYAPFDGWFNAEGVATTWGNTTAINVKFFQAIPEGTFTVCDMNGADQVGKTYSVKWALVNGDKKVVYTINVTFVEAPAPELDIVKTIEAGTVEYASTDGSYTKKTLTLTDEQVAEILTALGLSSMDDAVLYGYNPSTEEIVVHYEGADGWRDQNGDFAAWSGDAQVPVCVKYGPLDNPALDNKSFATYNIKGSFSGGIKTYWVFANAEDQAVLVEITFTYTASDAQKALEEEIANAEGLIEQSQGDGYDQDNEELANAVAALQAAIAEATSKLGTDDETMTAAIDPLKAAEEAFKGVLTAIDGIGVDKAAATIYDLSGRKVTKAQRGIYIVNGKKVVVK